MNRETLATFGLTDEQVESVLKEHGKDVAKLYSEMDKVKGEMNGLKVTIEEKDAELKRYQKGGDMFIDTKEHERLKLFEQDTLTAATNAKKIAALTKLYKSANASDSATKLFIKSTDLSKIELDDKEEVKNGAELIKQAKTDFPDFLTETAGGGAGTTHAGKTTDAQEFSFNFTGVREKPANK
jgi:hypothetical protein